MTIDYSKWDHLRGTSDEEEQSEDDTSKSSHNPRFPRVTRFDTPQSLTIGPTAPALPKTTPPQSSHNILNVSKAMRDGGSGTGYLWSQTSEEVSAHFFGLPLGLRGKEVHVKLLEGHTPAQPRSDEKVEPSETMTSGMSAAALQNARQSLGTLPDIHGRKVAHGVRISIKGEVFFEGTFPFSVLVDDDGNVDWELHTYSTVAPTDKVGLDFLKSIDHTVDTASLPLSSETPAASTLIQPSFAPLQQLAKNKCATICLRLTLSKHEPVAKVAIWWSCFRVGDPCIDVAHLSGRSKDALRGKAFRDAWDTAHKEFVRRVQSGAYTQKIPIGATPCDGATESQSHDAAPDSERV